MASIFTKICQGEIPCYRVAENDDCLAFLDISPIAVGHVLVIPKKEVDNIFDLDDETFISRANGYATTKWGKDVIEDRIELYKSQIAQIEQWITTF